MVKKIIKTNPNLIELINKLNKKSKTENAAIWFALITWLSGDKTNQKYPKILFSVIGAIQ